MSKQGEVSFLESVNKNFDKAASYTDIPKGLLQQIKVCNAVAPMGSFNLSAQLKHWLRS